jgi:hypothetical protein
MMQLTGEALLNIGFRDIAKWVKADKGSSIQYEIDGTKAEADFEVRNALYAFVQNETVCYVGKTARSIKQRFIGYCTPSETQTTNLRCHRNIKELTEEGKIVRIFVFTPTSQLRYGEFEIDLAAGLKSP